MATDPKSWAMELVAYSQADGATFHLKAGVTLSSSILVKISHQRWVELRRPTFLSVKVDTGHG